MKKFVILLAGIAVLVTPLVAQDVITVVSNKVGVLTSTPGAEFHVVDPSPGGNTAIVEGGALQVSRTDGPPANIRFSNANRSFLFAGNQNNQTFEIRDETAGQTPFIIFPSAGVGVLSIRQGRIGVGTLSPGHPIDTATGAHLTAGGTWQNASSRELKTAIANLSAEAAFAALAELEPVTFEYLAEPGEGQVGFIAEEVPQLVASADRKSLSPMDIAAVLTRAVKEQKVANDHLSTTVLVQAKQIDELLARIESLERR